MAHVCSWSGPEKSSCQIMQMCSTVLCGNGKCYIFWSPLHWMVVGSTTKVGLSWSVSMPNVVALGAMAGAMV